MFTLWMGLSLIRRSSSRDMGLHIQDFPSSIWRSSGDMRRKQGRMGGDYGENN